MDPLDNPIRSQGSISITFVTSALTKKQEIWKRETIFRAIFVQFCVDSFFTEILLNGRLEE